MENPDNADVELDVTPDEVRDMFAGLLGHLVSSMEHDEKERALAFIEDSTPEEIADTLTSMQDHIRELERAQLQSVPIIEDINHLAHGIHETLKIAHKPQLEEGALANALAVADAHRAAIIYLSDFVSHTFQDAQPCTNMLCEHCYSKDAAHIQ